MKLIAGWGTEGAFAYRLFPDNPGFALVPVDPETSHGRVVVEFPGFHNPSTSSRMHLELVAVLGPAVRPGVGGGIRTGNLDATGKAVRDNNRGGTSGRRRQGEGDRDHVT
ncbi:hypothetical protein GT755_04100 [Herbidospora sp. NEAU-GS84]|uniref:Uncharacterized protein n=1 Tax=Herbidospora solisilvae TaxID=2696284 RepID=A0A7C9J0H5_9ACTN|nr:hypothetical protein [Herbidospora solisilvae]NAS20866.1 hypothetical protein [Herbidospora solisilvae]